MVVVQIFYVCFCDVPGYFYSGQYLGNAEAGHPSPMINCGFQPSLVMIKEQIVQVLVYVG